MRDTSVGERAVKVGIVVPYSWSFRGGVVEHAEQQAQALQAVGVEVRLMVGLDPPGRVTQLLHPRPPRRDNPPEWVLPIGRSAVVPSNGALANVVLAPAAAGRIRRALVEEQFDLLHLHEPAVPVPCMAALLRADVPLVGTFHAAGRVPLLAIAKPTFGFLLDRLDVRIAVSAQARSTAMRYFPSKYEVVPNGAPFPLEAHSSGRSNTVTFVGRHDPRKGLATLLRAWPDIHRLTAARLRIIGADPRAVGPLLGRLRVDRGSVDLLGSVSDEALTAELLTTSVVVAPSLRNESFGMVITRAYACATPVVASDIDGYRDVVTRETGRLVPPGESAALCTAVVAMLSNETERSRLGTQAREVARSQYSWPAIVTRFLEIYAELLSCSAGKATVGPRQRGPA